MDALKAPPKGRVITVRLTAKCCYQCAHCCFECGPHREERMSLAIAQKTAAVMGPHSLWFNVMGGELTLLDDYPDLLTALNVVPLRIVTNGWWVKSHQRREQFLAVVRELGKTQHIHVGVSRDRFHPPGIGEEAANFLYSQGVNDDWSFSATKDPEQEAKAVAPVGRAWLNEIGDDFLRMFGVYCHAHDRCQSMTVLEDGTVTFCMFGAWPMGTLDDGFEVLEEGRLRRSKVFIPSCFRCWDTWMNHKRKTRGAQ